ncbi:MAG TPA: arginine--tRNA ligase [Verrucomicrobiae bacterium]|nr:arginine--tRNA ligase [Verrucomicrobiae bacterium]
MASAPEMIADAVERALGTVVGAENAGPAMLRPCADPKFGDYQANGIMAVAKRLKQNPKALADKVIGQLQLADVCEPPMVAGAGFINFKLKPEFVARQVSAAASDKRFGVPVIQKPKTVVIDFSSPNVAKPMHVGHIRSTIIGDCLARVMRFLGHQVITDNHLGDWGTQFGMLILGWKRFRNDDALKTDPIGELERLYKYVNGHEELRDEAKAELVKLQQGDAENVAIWKNIIDVSMQEFGKTFDRLGVQFDHVFGESFYNPLLKDVVDDLKRLGIAWQSEGAICVFFEDNPELKTAAPLIIQKADGAFLYGTTDMATLKYRIDQWHPDEIIYVTDARQQLHFKQVFATARKWWKQTPDLRHVYFGSILGEDGKPLKTREGAPVKLSALLDEAEERALAVVTEKNPELPEQVRRQVARVVGIGAVKYADLSQNRATDYVFSWAKMLAMTGNTAPYMQYAYVRVQSIFRKASGEKIDSASITLEHLAELDLGGAVRASVTPIALEHPAELDLAKHILRFPETLQAVADDDKPNWLTGYLFDLANKFSAFYENCPVLQSTEPTRSSRLVLCRLTADVIKCGLNLLGIDVIEQM